MDSFYTDANFVEALSCFLDALRAADEFASTKGFCVAADSEIHFNSVDGIGTRAVISRDGDFWDVRLENLPEVDLP